MTYDKNGNFFGTPRGESTGINAGFVVKDLGKKLLSTIKIAHTETKYY